MPRRLDPRKGLPGLFTPGRPKAADMSFFVDARAPGSPVVPPKDGAVAEETPPRPRVRPKKTAPIAPMPVTPAPLTPVPSVVAQPTPDYLLLAPPFRAVPWLRPEPEPVRLAEIPSFVRCGVSWIISLCRS